MKAILDTNVLIDYLNGFKKAKEELARYKNPGISIITWMEILIGAQNDAEEQQLKDFLAQFQLYELETDVALNAITIRRQSHLRLPDAIILATAQIHQALLVTRNTRDFSENNPTIRIPYRI